MNLLYLRRNYWSSLRQMRNSVWF